MTESNGQSFASLTVLENESVPDKATSENQPVENVLLTRSPLGLLDLPPELRLMIYRHLLVRENTLPVAVDTMNILEPHLLEVSILRTCRLVYREAFDIMYKENRFVESIVFGPFGLFNSPRIFDTIQTVYVSGMSFVFGDSWTDVPDYKAKNFLKVMRRVGKPFPIRRCLIVNVIFANISAPGLERFISALGRVTNFRIIELRLTGSSPYSDDFSKAVEYFEHALKPVLGNVVKYCKRDSAHKTLQFQPVIRCD